MKWVLIVCVLTSCQQRPPTIKIGDATVAAPANAQAATILNQGGRTEVLTLPKGSTITTIQTPELPATPDAPAQPPKKTTIYTLAGDSTQKVEEKTSHAEIPPPRAPDKQVELAAQRDKERRPFLWGAGGLALACGVLFYLHLAPIARICALGSGICLVFWWAVGNEKLLTWGVCIVAGLGLAYIIYIEWKKSRTQGTLKTIVQSVEEYSVDHPLAAKVLKSDYLAANMDEAHKEEVLHTEKGIDRTYLDEAIKAKITPTPAAPLVP